MTRDEWIIEAMSLANALADAAGESGAFVAMRRLTGRSLQTERACTKFNFISSLESLELHLNRVPEFTTTPVTA
jgi:hypothetical protein